MKTDVAPVCAEHRLAREWRTAVFEYDEDGISIRIPNVEAWVCPADGDPSFLTETADELISVGRELLAAARRARQRRSALTEYIVSVGSR
jgi:RNA polymerase subunit RPABC4/transcription elongation factor Spt4